MSEPIKLYDLDGNLVTMYSPKVAEDRVAAGLLLTSPPAPKKAATKKPAASKAA